MKKTDHEFQDESETDVEHELEEFKRFEQNEIHNELWEIHHNEYPEFDIHWEE